MELLERDAALRALGDALGCATRGAGRVALVSGEAGIGKTALVERFASGGGAGVRTLWGTCDAEVTPRPLGPLRDIAAQAADRLTGLLDGRLDRAAIFDATLAELARRPSVVVFEDVHWADDATLDLLRFLGRRIARTSALLILTYRDDELGSIHPLRTVLGDLAASPAALRVPLRPLSAGAVRALAGDRPIDAVALHRRTGGNPFFVTEILAGADDGLPDSVRDAVLGRVARLTPPARAVLEAAAVVGPRVEPALLAAMLPLDAAAADECLAGGVLVAQGGGLAFRHELARQAVIDAIPPLRRIRLHRLALAALRAAPGRPDPADLLRHASGGADGDAVLAYAPAAAHQAAAAGAHRVAADLYALALPWAEARPPAEHAALVQAHAWECHLIADLDGAICGRRRAVELWRTAGDPLKEGENLAMLAMAYVTAGRRDEARRASQAAIDLLAGLAPSRGLALAYRTRALLHQFDHELADAIAFAERAIAIGERLDDAQSLAMANDTLGVALMYLDYQRGRRHLERARAIADQAGLDSSVARAYANIGSNAAELYRLDDAERDLAAGLAYTAERDLDSARLYMLGWTAVVHVLRGRWLAAAVACADVLDAPAVSDSARWAALIALGRLRARRGDPEAFRPLDLALDLALGWGELQMIGTVRAARAEAAWLAGDPARAGAEAVAAYPVAADKRHRWLTGELAYWLRRAGAVEPVPEWVAPPFALHLAGDWAASADAWRELGCPYEEARALADGDAPAQEQALAILDRLGARPAAATLRHAMRERGVTRLPRGPRPITRANPFGLTARQHQIFDLLAEGCTNAEIAARLSIAPKTAEHHVAAVLAKLGVSTRRAAAGLARPARPAAQDR